MSSEMRIGYVGIAWYRRDQWDQIVAIMADRTVLPATYSAWLHAAQQVEQQVKRSGAVPVRAYIDPATFPDWCRTRGLDVNAKARMEYANLIAHQQDRSGHAYTKGIHAGTSSVAWALALVAGGPKTSHRK